MKWEARYWRVLAPVLFVAVTLAGCVGWIRYGDGILKGRVVVQWTREDKFIYLKTGNPLSFQPSFLNTPIVPETMYTDGGSIPRIFWSIPGLSPWGLGPAYVIHDWLFEVHRCHRPAPPEVAAITFEQSAQVLAEVGKSLVEAGLVDNNKLDEIVWAIQTRYARNIWDSAPAPGECAIPILTKARPRTVVDFTVPVPNRSIGRPAL
ncbi:DUF1353 domain-containing protein [Bradyrhizobium sp. CCBAU 53415]|uniref:DUF1353 domain-containing protein n=1 Tax=Bradyrhizobium sp. CCBAU 53415 TaxID=1325119 RepID=UPI0023056FD6|nr:DUF1353 domain-containing protein [Bradyrhizobium sp. CCBAU 53415]